MGSVSGRAAAGRRRQCAEPAAGSPAQKCLSLELGYKPGSVLALVAARKWWSFLLAARCRTARATNSGSGFDAGHAGRLTCDPSSVLLQVGFAMPLLSPGERCALTTPFHPCRWHGRPRTGGCFSVALSFESPRLAVSQHPARRSPDFPRRSPKGAATTHRLQREATRL